MPRVNYVAHDGARREVEVPVGENVMRGALYNGVEGVVGECGGALSCATCRCFVDPAWSGRVGPPPTQEERDLLADAEAIERGAGQARLSCQIVMTADLDGLVVHLPEHQYL